MNDEDFRDDHEFEDIDKDQLDAFERELNDESKKKKKKLYLVAGGTVVCAGALLFFSGWMDQQETVKRPVPVKASATATAEKAPDAKAADAKAPAPKAMEAKPQAVKTDAEMEAAQQKNVVETDSRAPGAVAEALPSPEAKPAGGKDQKGVAKPASPADPKAVHSPSTASSGFIVQAVATSDADRAISARDDLVAKGYKSWISIGKVKESVFVVEAGEFASIKDSAPQKEKLEKAGFEIRMTQSGAKTSLVAGMFQDKAGADAVAARLKTAGFASKVVNRKEPSDLYLVRVGPYHSADEAKKAGDTIKTAGYNPLSVAQ
ncbi:MAG: SPOR domain-containing protein [Nitrospinae bacterium]|nr:SPOR domain-containing protein [Nitrospinota bacterium]MBF0634914.1 SPOR domain-containing protein [Nitrospinota bacterium]